MKVQCELCREIVPLADFTPSTAGLEIVCPACHGTYFVAAPARLGAAGAAASAVGEGGGPATAGGDRREAAEADLGMTCPKCGRRQAAAAACRQCGLLIAAWDPASTPGLAGDDEARRLFAAVEAAWHEPRRHDAFIELCAARGQLPFAARCYRERLARDPGDLVARAQQARVVTVAEATLLTRPRDAAEAPVPHRGLLVALVIAIFGVLIAALTSPLWRWWK